jgi:hypothetical protein
MTERVGTNKTTSPMQPRVNAMEGAGAYNRHAKLQAAGASRAFPFFARAAEDIPLEDGHQPVVIADYGSSQGANSMTPMSIAVRRLRRRVGPERPIFVFHVDLPTNDFTSLFEVADTDPNTYVQDDPNVLPCAIGRSFYKTVFPSSSVALGWSSYAAHWLSRIPACVPGHFVMLDDKGEAGAAFKSQSVQDWEAFLTLRARELRPGGRLLVTQPARDDNNSCGIEDLCHHANDAFAEMVEEGLITSYEHARMVLGFYLRRTRDLLAPFQRGGRFENLHLASYELASVPDTAWADYLQDGDIESLGSRHALFFRTAFAPSLATALTCAPNDERYRTFGDQLEARLKRRLTARPAPVNTFVATMVLIKEEGIAMFKPLPETRIQENLAACLVHVRQRSHSLPISRNRKAQDSFAPAHCP